VRQVIRREFKISLSVVSVGRLLRTMGLSPQRPLYRAYQQNPEVQRWKDEQFPAIRAAAKAEGHDLLRRRGRGSLGPVLAQHALRGLHTGRAAVQIHEHGEPHGVHRLRQTPAPRRRRPGLPGRERPDAETGERPGSGGAHEVAEFGVGLVGVPWIHSWTWSMAALAADAADDAPRVSMTAAPRLATLGVKTLRVQVSSASVVAVVPLTSAGFGSTK
jgi:hypothetical protein